MQKLTIYKAGREAGVHRSTIYRWIEERGLLADEGKVDLDEVKRFRDEKKRGRPCGTAYGHLVRRALRDFEAEFSASLIVVAHVLEILPPDKRQAVCEEFLPKLSNQGALTDMLKGIAQPPPSTTAPRDHETPKKAGEPQATQPAGKGAVKPDKAPSVKVAPGETRKSAETTPTPDTTKNQEKSVKGSAAQKPVKRARNKPTMIQDGFGFDLKEVKKISRADQQKAKDENWEKQLAELKK